jgi:two-component system cell cycle response regulator
VPILAISDADNNSRLLRGLEIGVNDYLLRPVDKNELLARARTQVRKRRYTDHLRDNVQNSIEAAITDALTGLHNRRYMESHLSTLADQAGTRGKPLALMVLDIDFFKSINDGHGHDAGDDVLREFADRVKAEIREVDTLARYGGEEFVLVLPETTPEGASRLAERVCEAIRSRPFTSPNDPVEIPVTVSVGAAVFPDHANSASTILRAADRAMYRAKRAGRDQWVVAEGSVTAPDR